MTTINISLPEKLKDQASALVESGFYASFSDLIRDALRQTIAKNRYDLWTKEVKRDLEHGKAKILKSEGAIDDYLREL